ncbi:unnamed protein product [Rotaria magnacalcarata]|uniref:BEN domain-containing protein n=1 Tax=Rotaria magnacalcarata TaxID=392030 RepID=A0A816K990_9BILA|nr:unnamed protein product [Rotaria magnacalcarata]
MMDNINRASEEEHIDHDKSGVVECSVVEWKVADLFYDDDNHDVKVCDEIEQEHVEGGDDDEVIAGIKSMKSEDNFAGLVELPAFSKSAAVDFSETLNPSSLMSYSIKSKKNSRLFEEEDDNGNDTVIDLVSMENEDGLVQDSSYSMYSLRKKQRVEQANETKASEKYALGNRMIKKERERESKPHQVRKRSETSDIKSELSDQEISLILDLSLDELKKCHRKTATATCRNILHLKYSYSSTNIKFSYIDRCIIDAIINYTKRSNPTDLSTDPKLRRAMSLYFAGMTYKAKKKLDPQNK